MSDKPPNWPPGVEPMVLQDLERLGTDKTNRLYWDGKLVRTPLVLTTPQNVLAVLAALASIATVITGMNNAAVFLCARNIDWLSCPAAPQTDLANSHVNIR